MVALILSAVITPDATLFTMLLMAVPLIILYEIGIWGAKAFGRKPQPDMDTGRGEEEGDDMTDEAKT